MAYINLFAGLWCLGLAVVEFCLLKNTRQWSLFFDLLFAGLNLWWAARGFGWL